MIPKVLMPVIEAYSYEPVDDITIKHINEHSQAVLSGPYKFYIDSKEQICIKFEFESDEQRTWWILKHLT